MQYSQLLKFTKIESIVCVSRFFIILLFTLFHIILLINLTDIDLYIYMHMLSAYRTAIQN